MQRRASCSCESESKHFSSLFDRHNHYPHTTTTTTEPSGAKLRSQGASPAVRGGCLFISSPSQSTRQPLPHRTRQLGPITPKPQPAATLPHTLHALYPHAFPPSLFHTSLLTGVGMSATFNPPIAALIAWTIICGSAIILTNVAKFTKYIDKDNAGYVDCLFQE